MARLTRVQAREQTKSKLLAAARDLMAQEGYENASIDAIAEHAGYSKGAFYSNFSSKEEIFLELLEIHANQDVIEISALLEGVNDPPRMIAIISDWASNRAKDPSWGLLALELFRRARREATFGERHAKLFRNQWMGLGKILTQMFPKGGAPANAETLGGIVFELTYGAASSFTKGPSVGDLVRTALMALYIAYGVQAKTPGARAQGKMRRPKVSRASSPRS